MLVLLVTLLLPAGCEVPNNDKSNDLRQLLYVCIVFSHCTGCVVNRLETWVTQSLRWVSFSSSDLWTRTVRSLRYASQVFVITVKMPQSVPELPDAVLGTIFQHVPLKQRLSCCALVCRAWAAAASATTAHLDASVSASNAQALESWIDRHAEQLASINLHHSYHGIPTLELHCSKLTQLQQLVVSSLINLQLHTGQPARSTRSSRRSSTSTSTLLLPHLRDLQLHGCSYPLQHLKQLSKLTALTSLYLGSAYVLQTPYSQKVASADAVQSTLSSVLSQMHCLRKLAFGKSSFLMWHKTQHPAVRHLSSMQSLESLQIMHRCPAFETFLPHLPSSITALLLSDTEVTGELQAATRLTALRHFELNAAEMDPGVLLSWPSLQHLHLSSIMLTCASAGNGGAAAPQPAALLAAAAGNGVAAAPQAAALLAAFDAVMAGGGNGNAEAPAVASAVPEGEAELQQFLQALQQLTQLQHLHLAAISLEAGSQAVLHQQQQFSALVASPELTSLELAVHYGMPLPLVGLRQLFAPGAQLPALRVLRLRGRPAQPPEPQLGANDLVALAAACPGLQVTTCAAALMYCIAAIACTTVATSNHL